MIKIQNIKEWHEEVEKVKRKLMELELAVERLKLFEFAVSMEHKHNDVP